MYYSKKTRCSWGYETQFIFKLQQHLKRGHSNYSSGGGRSQPMKDISTKHIFRGLLSTLTHKVKLNTTNELIISWWIFKGFLLSGVFADHQTFLLFHTCRASVYLLQTMNCSKKTLGMKTFPKQGWYIGSILSQAITLLAFFSPTGTVHLRALVLIRVFLEPDCSSRNNS